MNRSEIVSALESARRELLEAIDGLTPEQMARPGAVGEWSVRDVLQHISLWEAELVRLLLHVKKGRRPGGERYSGEIDVDALNARWHEETRHRPLERVLDDFHAVRRQTLRWLDEFSDDELTRPRKAEWLRGEPLWRWIADDSFEHDQEHAAQIRAWREKLE
jgi:uncharacterized protein (TIGR03083 family)